MNSVEQKNKLLFRFFPYLLLFLFGTFFLYRFTDYIFFYQEKSSLFLVSLPYLIDHLHYPGGFLEYLGTLQTSFYYYPIIGAVLVSIEVCGIVLLLQSFAEKPDRSRFVLVPFVVGAAIFLMQTNYQYQALNTLGILFQLILYRVITPFKPKFQWISVVLLPLAYFLFGSFSFLLLGMMTLFFILEKSWLKLLVSWLAVAVFFVFGSRLLFYQTTESLFVAPLETVGIGGQVKLFSATALLILFVPLLSKLKLKVFDRLRIKKNHLNQFTPYIILLVLAVLVFNRVDEKNRDYFQAEKLFYAQQYDELIRFNQRFPTNNKLTLFLNNVALAETGKLADSFFRFRQSPDGSTLFLNWEIISEILKRGGFYYYATGMVNEAQRWAYEYMVMQGNTPESLTMMIKTELIKGNYKTAEKYISILEKSLFYKKRAQDLRKFLNDDQAVLADKDLGEKRRLDTKLDFFVQSDKPWVNLLPVLQSDSTNRIALEYELAWLMLQKDMKGIVALLPAMEKAGYTKIPKNVEEAVVTYKLLRVGELPELTRLQINPQTEQRFQRYYQLFQQNQGNKQKAQNALREFADTYWYYVFFD
ncbi:DUF6057 family protein [Maribellus sediminis]|uniref:DUF6057 family protein n=1 Tax=Maribellus sediminis TaxID=2696285 RepID=UPI00143027DF|nr:DUF6057 family protein [Maribellus sediminis]